MTDKRTNGPTAQPRSGPDGIDRAPERALVRRWAWTGAILAVAVLAAIHLPSDAVRMARGTDTIRILARQVVLPGGLLMPAGAAIGAGLAVLVMMRRMRQGRCHRCGHARTGGGERCPECGTWWFRVPVASVVLTLDAGLKRTRRLALPLWLTGLAAGSVAWTATGVRFGADPVTGLPVATSTGPDWLVGLAVVAVVAVAAAGVRLEERWVDAALAELDGAGGGRGGEDVLDGEDGRDGPRGDGEGPVGR